MHGCANCLKIQALFSKSLTSFVKYQIQHKLTQCITGLCDLFILYQLYFVSYFYYLHIFINVLTMSYTAIIGIASFTAVAENGQCKNNGI